MIAMNYIKHPEALRFQCEMFSNGYHNSPRIMRLMQCIFDQRPDVPQWFKDMRAKAKALVKAWKNQMIEMFDGAQKKSKVKMAISLFPAPEPKGYWMESITAIVAVCNSRLAESLPLLRRHSLMS